MALPKLSAQQRIANPDGKPSSPFLQFMEAARTAQILTDETQDDIIAELAQAVADILAAQAAADAAAAAAATADAKAVAAQADADTALTLATDASNDVAQVELDFDGLIAGTTPFTAINVGGTTIAESGGLAAEIVTTAAIAPDNITTRASAFTEATLAYSGSGYDTAQTVTLTTAGGPVEISASIIFNGNDPTLGVTALLSVERDGVAIWGPYSVCESYTTATGTQSLLQTVALTLPDVPAAGSHTWDLKFSYLSGSAKNVRSRFLSVREMKTET